MMPLTILPRILLLPAVLMVALSPGISAESLLTPPTVDYSATVVREVSGKSRESKIFYTQNRMRTELEAGGHLRIAIVNRDKKEMFSIDPGTQTYYKMDLSGQGEADPADATKYASTFEGKETIDGIETNRYKYTGNSQGMQFKGTIWVTKDNIPLKTESSVDINGQTIKSVSHLKNLHVEKQEQSLFEVPAGYSAMAAPGMPKRN